MAQRPKVQKPGGSKSCSAAPLRDPLQGAVALGSDDTTTPPVSGLRGRGKKYPRKFPDAMARGQSLEMFLGYVPSFPDLQNTILTRSVQQMGKQRYPKLKATLSLEGIRKIVVILQPVTSFRGMGAFSNMKEAWVTHCDINDSNMSDFTGKEPLRRMFINNCKLTKLSVPPFQHLKILSVASNRLSSLDFLNRGLPCLKELNAARNDICSIALGSLKNCPCLEIMNMSSNPLSKLQDIRDLQLTKVKHLVMEDLLYGSCPLINLGDGRQMIISVLPQLETLDDKEITSEEHAAVKEFVTSRSAHYCALSQEAMSLQAERRQHIVETYNEKLGSTQTRLVELVSAEAHYRRAVDNFPTEILKTKQMLNYHLEKIQTRESKLLCRAKKYIKQVDLKLEISFWEEEVEKWANWIEFLTFGNTQCYFVFSVHGSLAQKSEPLVETIQQLICAMGCPSLSVKKVVDVESVVAINDGGLEAGMDAVFAEKIEKKFLPRYVKPGPEFDAFMRYCKRGAKKPNTFCSAKSKRPTKCAFPFPDSIPGLPERSQPVFMFLICPKGLNPVAYLHKLLTRKAAKFKKIRVTNCLWSAIPPKTVKPNFVVVIVKILSEFLTALPPVSKKHISDCKIYSLKRPLVFTPAYLLNVSITTDDSDHGIPQNDDDVLGPAVQFMKQLHAADFPYPVRTPKKRSCYVQETDDGMEGNLTAVQLNLNDLEKFFFNDRMAKADKSHQTPLDTRVVPKFFGQELIAHLTTLKLSGNRIPMVVGLDQFSTLTMLDLSHNSLTTFAGLQNLPNLQELKAGWNYIRFFQSTLSALSTAAPNLLVVELLPNVFQDVTQLRNIPTMLQRALPKLQRVDYWKLPLPARRKPLPASVYRRSGFLNESVDLLWGSEQVRGSKSIK